MKIRVFAFGCCILFLFTCIAILPIEAIAEKKKLPISDKALNALFQQLILDCKASAPDPKSLDSIKRDEPASNYIEIKIEPLVKGRTTYLISGIKSPFVGARTSMYWIYEKTASGYRQVVDLGASDQLSILKSTHNGYRDIDSMSIIEGGTRAIRCKLVFNGSKYVNDGCKEFLF